MWFLFCLTNVFFLSCFIVPAKAILITSTCALLLIAVIILAYIKMWVVFHMTIVMSKNCGKTDKTEHLSLMQNPKYCTLIPLLLLLHILVHIVICFFLSVKRRRSRAGSSDVKQHHQEYIQTEEWTCVKNIKQTKIAAPEDQRIEVDDNAS